MLECAKRKNRMQVKMPWKCYTFIMRHIRTKSGTLMHSKWCREFLCVIIASNEAYILNYKRCFGSWNQRAKALFIGECILWQTRTNERVREFVIIKKFTHTVFPADASMWQKGTKNQLCECNSCTSAHGMQWPLRETTLTKYLIQKEWKVERNNVCWKT